MKVIYSAKCKSPVGNLFLASTENGLCALQMFEDDFDPVKWAIKFYPEYKMEDYHQVLDDAVDQLSGYFCGYLKKFEIPLDLQGTEFQKKVWNELLNIPYGETRSYKEIAEKICNPKAMRSVGQANNKNPIGIIIPCHRVIGSSGKLVGYAGGIEKKSCLLALEQSYS